MTERRVPQPTGLGLGLPVLTATSPRPALRSRLRVIERYELPILLAVVATIYLLLSAYVIIDRDLHGGDPASRLLNAHLVMNGEERKLASIGFVFAPLLTLTLLPVAAIPPLFESFYGVGVVSALWGTAAVYFIWKIVRLYDFRWPMRLAIVGLFAFNPIILVFALNGMGESMAYTFLAGGAYHLLALDQESKISHVVFAGIFLGLAAVTRYELAFVAVVVGALLYARYVWEEPMPETRTDDSRWGRGQGVFLAFASMAAYPMLLWMLMNWLIMGHPLWFASGDQGILNVTPEDAAQGFLGGLQTSTYLTAITFPLSFVSAAGALFVGFKRRSTGGILLGGMVLTLPGVQVVMLAIGIGLEILRYYTLAIPLSFAALLYTYAAFRDARLTWIGHRARPWVLLGLLLSAAVVSGYTLETQEQRSNIEHSTWKALQGVRVPPGLLEEGTAIGREVEAIIPPGERVLIDYFGTAYTVRFGITDRAKILDFTSPDFEAAAKNPWSFVDWVLLPEPIGRHLLNPIHIHQPGIYQEVSVIAEKVAEWPESGNRWKLFRLLRDGSTILDSELETDSPAEPALPPNGGTP